ncbi:hypothetical protein U1Q18_045843 [Sarracenia purpurea var. burkii]
MKNGSESVYVANYVRFGGWAAMTTFKMQMTVQLPVRRRAAGDNLWGWIEFRRVSFIILGLLFAKTTEVSGVVELGKQRGAVGIVPEVLMWCIIDISDNVWYGESVRVSVINLFRCNMTGENGEKLLTRVSERVRWGLKQFRRQVPSRKER